ncbi:MAG: histidine phosphatase family protein [Candidatus Margulisbacteria bacterium]|nr:histidine phosphatase family protein [Candidatus Margulisiibacteriota bacterium]
MSRIFLIRHGETKANSELRYQGQIDTPLNKTGLKQAEQLSRQFKKIALKKIYTSNLQRAIKTAEILAKYQAAKIIQLPKLRERDFGAWENLTFQDIQNKYLKTYLQWQKNPDANIPHAENFTKFQNRVIAGLKKILRALKEKEDIAIVAHGGPNRIILQYFLNSPSPENFWKIKQDNACINIIEYTKKYQIVSLLNYHGNNQSQASIKY